MSAFCSPAEATVISQRREPEEFRGGPTRPAAEPGRQRGGHSWPFGES